MAILGLIFGSRGKASDSKMRSKRLKYVLFCNEIGALPLLPTKPANILRFALWLPTRGINSGWKGCMAYVTEVCNWNKNLGFEDPRVPISHYLTQFRHNFRRLVTTHHPAVKLPIRPGLLEAMMLDADLSKATDVRDMACYLLLFFLGLRIGHCAVSSPSQAQHALRFEDLHFHPSFACCEKVLVCVRSTKTRFRAAGLPFWTALARQPHLPFCPVALLQAHYMLAWRGDPSDFLFTGNKTDRTGRITGRAPLVRSTFNTTLRRRLTMAVNRLGIDLDISMYSGISFRKGCLSTLGALNVPAHRLADHADHADVASSRIYTVDTLDERATNTTLIASKFQARAHRL